MLDESTDRPLLLVEGMGDLHFVQHFCRKAPMPMPNVRSLNGVQGVLGALRQEVNLRGNPPVGVIVDADADISERWMEIVSNLGAAKTLAPKEPEAEGTVIIQAAGLPRIGIWIMPDNQSTGELEDFVIDMIPDGDAIWPTSVNYIETIPTIERQFTEHKTDRAKLYAWLATRKHPPHIGAAIRDGYLHTDTARCQSFALWLRRLYGNWV